MIVELNAPLTLNPNDRQVVECASPLALWLGQSGRGRKRQRTGALHNLAVYGGSWGDFASSNLVRLSHERH